MSARYFALLRSITPADDDLHRRIDELETDMVTEPADTEEQR